VFFSVPNYSNAVIIIITTTTTTISNKRRNTSPSFLHLSIAYCSTSRLNSCATFAICDIISSVLVFVSHSIRVLKVKDVEVSNNTDVANALISKVKYSCFKTAEALGGDGSKGTSVRKSGVCVRETAMASPCFEWPFTSNKRIRLIVVH
jgi:hypothetical protein